MIDDAVALIAFPDFGMETNGKLFIWDGNVLSSRTLNELSNQHEAIVTFDFSLIASEMLNQGIELPTTVIDLEELVVAASKIPRVSKIREEFKIGLLLKRFGLSEGECSEFLTLSCNSGSFPVDLLTKVGVSILRAFDVVARLASSRDEWKRFISVEVPVARSLYSDLMEGVLFDPESLAIFREQIEYDYYKALKTFSAKHDLPLEVPSKGNLERILADAGFDLQNTSVEYLLEFVSFENDLGDDVQSLRKLSATRNALNGISHKKNRCFPQVLAQGTRTSRILLKSPTIQNVAKKYRSIIIPNTGKKLSYIDYDQFEVGIMGALSDDPVLLELYAQDDIYLAIAEHLFGAHGSRKHAKKLFLSYAYGMRKNNLVDAAVSLGSTRVKAREAFNQFAVFENWKKSIERELKTHRKVGTSLGNFFHLRHKHHPTAKEVRSAISQKVQGTGALIFKLALLKISPLHDFRVVLPMHDAVLIEHSLDSDPEVVATAFANAMTNFFANKIVGKASISDFFAD